jgi:hypothetical protein
MALAQCALGQGVSTELHGSHDSDGLDQRALTVAAATAEGWGMRATAARYTAPGGWSEDGRVLAATYQRASESARFDAAAGLARIGRHDRLVGSIDVLQPVGAAGTSSLGFSAQRQMLDSRAGIDAGLTYESGVLVADHAFSPRFNLGVAAGATWFSDGNRRPLLRTRWNYAVRDDMGLNAYVKTRSYQNSDPYRPEYFSPERLNEVSLGLSSRVVANGTVVSAALDAGSQHTELDVEPIWSLSLGVSSPRKARVQWSLVAQTAHTAALLRSTSTYRYSSITGRISVPL